MFAINREHDEPSARERSLRETVYATWKSYSSKEKKRRRDGNETADDGNREAEFLANDFFAEQSQRRILQRRRASWTKLGLAEKHLLATTLTATQVVSIER